MDKLALGQFFPRVLRFSLVNFIPPEKRKKLIMVTGLYNKPQGCGAASVASAPGPFTTKKDDSSQIIHGVSIINNRLLMLYRDILIVLRCENYI